MYSFGDVAITGEGLQILTYAGHSWPRAVKDLSSATLTACDSFYNGHLRGRETLTPVAERLAVKLSQPVFTNKVCRGWD